MHVGVQGLQETPWPTANVSAVVTAHDGLDGLGGFVGVVEGDGADVVVEHVGFDDAMEELAADEAEFAVDGGCGAARVGPAGGGVVGERGVGVLQEGDGDCGCVSRGFLGGREIAYRASG